MTDNIKQLQDHFSKVTAESKTLSIAFLVGVAHIVAGLCMLYAKSVQNVTPLYFAHVFFKTLGFNEFSFATTLIAAGILAIVGTAYGLFLPRRLYIFCFFPQQILLLLQICSITLSVVSGAYPDGYVPQGGPWFMLGDQIWAWMLSIAHTLWFWFLLFGKRR